MKEISLEAALGRLGEQPYTLGIKDGKKKLLKSTNKNGLHFLEEDGRITKIRAWDLLTRKFYIDEVNTLSDKAKNNYELGVYYLEKDVKITVKYFTLACQDIMQGLNPEGDKIDLSLIKKTFFGDRFND